MEKINHKMLYEDINKLMGPSIFIQKFGDSPMNRIMDFLMLFSDEDFYLKLMAGKSGVSYSTTKILAKELVKKEFIIHTKNIGKAKMYRLNKKNYFIKQFANFYWEITNIEVDKRIKEDGLKEKEIKIKA